MSAPVASQEAQGGAEESKGGLWVVGIDPGAKGALVALRPDGIEITDMLEPHDLADLFIEWSENSRGNIQAVVERAQAMPHQGVASVAKYMLGYGTILGILTAFRIPYETVHPGVWKRKMGVTADKNATREAARRIWPREKFRRADHAEAALLALYWERHVQGRGGE